MIAFLNDILFLLPWPWPLVIVVTAMGLIAVFAYLKRSLDASGAAGAYIMGVIVLWTMRFEGFLLFLLFFLSCNVMGKISKRLRTGKAPDEVEEKKGSRRDFMQVMSNGLMTVIAALIWYFTGKVSALIMFGASVAEATSDTFAGEVGRLSKHNPVSIRDLRPVPKGLSGGVTALGTMGAFLASAMIAVCWYLWFDGVSFAAASLVCITGFAGAVIDSYLGACVQAHYIDPDTGMLTEHEQKNGKALELSRGIRWVDNDMVNLLSNVFSAVFALGMSALVVEFFS